MDLHEYQRFAVYMAKEAGDIMEKDFILGMKKQWKADETLVTATDLAINNLVIERVHQQYPDHDILSEEGSDTSHHSDFVWVCDPINGTIPFAHGIPTCAFSLALTYQGESLVGVVYDPFLDRLFVAANGCGATMNGQTIHVSQDTNIAKAIVCAEYWKDADYNLSGVASALDQQDAVLISPCSMTYMASLVAGGECAATIFPGTKPYGSAAIRIIIQEAGGKMTDLFGNEQRYDAPIKGHVTSNGLIHAQILALIKQQMIDSAPASP